MDAKKITHREKCQKNNMYILMATFLMVISFINLTWYLNQKEEVLVPIRHLHAVCPATNIITVQFGGRLGNNIWEYMSLLAVLHLYNSKFKFSPFIPKPLKIKMMSLFQSVNTSELSEIPSECYKIYRPYLVGRSQTFKPKQISDDQFYKVTLATWSARYEDIVKYGIDKIKTELRFQQKLIDYANYKLEQFKKQFNMSGNNVTYVGMHYRGTDYPRFLKRNYKGRYKGPPDYRYYATCMNILKNQHQNIIFILVTIDENWLKKNIPFLIKNNNLIVNPNRANIIEDLVLLSSCNHSIISYGTYAATSALFAGGTTYVYDTELPLDKYGATIVLGLASLLPNWHLLK